MFHPAKIIRRVQASPTVVVLDLDVDLQRTSTNVTTTTTTTTTTFQPGQWVDFMAPSQDWVGGFSPASSPRDLPLLRLAIKRSRHPPAEWIHSDDCLDTINNHRTVKIRFGGESTLVPLFIPKPEKTVTAASTNEVGNHGHQPTTTTEDDRYRRVRPYSAVFVAGGIGISPILSQYREFLYQREKLVDETKDIGIYNTSRTKFLYTVSTEDELVFGDEIGDLFMTYNQKPKNRQEGDKQNFLDRIVFAITKTDHCWNDEGMIASQFPQIERRNGRIMQDFLDESVNELEEIQQQEEAKEKVEGSVEEIIRNNRRGPIYYVCGPPSMIDDAVSHLKTNGVDDDRIKYEKWW